MTPTSNLTAHRDALTNRLGLRLAAALNDAAADVPHDLSERLRVAREQALARAAQVRRVQAASAVASQPNGTAVLSGPPALWLRLASVVPLIMLVAGFMLINYQQDLEQIAAAAEIDSALLADELPPEAYGDPGFRAFLKSGPTP